MDAKRLGERLRMIRRYLGFSQQQLAKATNLTQPTISRLENGEEVYASALLAVLKFFQDKVSLDLLFDPDLESYDISLLFCNHYEIRKRLNSQLTAITHKLEESLDQIAALKNQI